ncbi:MAG: response regulator transcription factor [Candidatus Doudnabacteria bacterium]|nr:response regulator transcription factor [Candidatus Doudnabacteria bacterium]
MKILVIEDNTKLANSLKRGLEQENYAVDLLFDGESGERRLKTRRDIYDLVILDVMLPGKNGVAVCAAWRADNIITPVLMLTSRDTTEDKVLGLDSGADDYLIKPFEFTELLARIRALSRRPQTSQSESLLVGPLILNNAKKQLTLGGQPLNLTLRELRLLEYFMRHPGQVLSRDQILAAVWDFSFDSFSNVVDVHIKNLRKKLGDYGKNLQTVRGLGYRLEF